MFEGIRIACKHCEDFETFPGQRYWQLARRQGYRCATCGMRAGEEAAAYFQALYALDRAWRHSRDIRICGHGCLPWIENVHDEIMGWILCTLEWVHSDLSVFDVRLMCCRCHSKWFYYELGSEEFAEVRRWTTQAGCPTCGPVRDVAALHAMYDQLPIYNAAYQRLFGAGFNAAPANALPQFGLDIYQTPD